MESDSTAAFARRHVRPRAGRTLIVGSYVVPGKTDRRMLYRDAVGVDMRSGMGVDVVANLEDPQPGLGLFAHVECCSVLEHSRRPWLMAANIEALMLPGATLHVSVPFIWRPHAYPSDYWRMTVEALPVLFPRIDWKVCMYGGEELIDSTRKLPGLKREGFPYFGRAETFGFGVLA